LPRTTTSTIAPYGAARRGLAADRRDSPGDRLLHRRIGLRCRNQVVGRVRRLALSERCSVVRERCAQRRVVGRR